MTTSYLLLTCIMAVTYFQYGDCTKCYTCSSLTDPKCMDPMMPDESKATQCTSDAMKKAADLFNSAGKTLTELGSSLGMNVSPKVVDANLQCSKIDVTEGDKKFSVRGCSMPPTENFDPCKTITDKYQSDTLKVSFCGICNTDYCNSANSMKVTFAFLLPLLAILISNYN